MGTRFQIGSRELFDAHYYNKKKYCFIPVVIHVCCGQICKRVVQPAGPHPVGSHLPPGGPHLGQCECLPTESTGQFTLLLPQNSVTDLLNDKTLLSITAVYVVNTHHIAITETSILSWRLNSVSFKVFHWTQICPKVGVQLADCPGKLSNYHTYLTPPNVWGYPHYYSSYP